MTATPKEMCEADGGSYANGECTTAAELLAERQAEQRGAISAAIDAATTAVAAVDDEATDDQVSAANAAVAAARTAISGAADVPQAEKGANTATVDALASLLSGAVTSRQMAMEAAAETARLAAISAAQTTLTGAQEALAALGDDATDEEKRDANRMVEAAANALRDTLQMNGGSAADIEAAIRTAQTAKVAADALQTIITAAANAKAAQQMAAINAAQTTLTGAQEALAALGDDATDKQVRDAHRAVERAAAALIQVLEANEGTATQIAAATMTRDSAKTMADNLTSPIEIADQRQAITDALAAVATAVAAVDNDSTDAEVKAADDAIAAARKAIEDATELPQAERTANGLVVNVHATALDTAKTSRTAAIAAKAEEERKAAAAVVTKAAGTKLAAMNAEAGRAAADPDEGLGGHVNTAADTVAYALAISRDRTGTEVTVTDPALNQKASPKFVDQMAGLDAGRVMFVRTKDADADGNVEEEVVVVGTDIKAPRVVAFGKVTGQGQSEVLSQVLNARDLDTDVDADGDGTNNNDFTALFVGTGVVTDTIGSATTPEVRALVKSAAFPLTGDGELRFDFDDTATTNADEADEVRGTYNGAMGTYRCHGTAQCTVTIGPDTTDPTKRAITGMSVGWIFTPDAGVTSDVPDTNYLHYGFWLKKTTDADGVLAYDEVETFAGASADLAASTDVSAVTGTASYDGDAVGVYVHHVLSEGGGKIDSSTSGHFKADASLTATFGQVPVSATDTTGTIAPNLLNTITGTIDNFTLSGGEAQDWSVNLARQAITTGTGVVTGGMAEGGGVSGSYSATFHGSVAAAADGTVPKPSAVVGEFNANMSNGSVAGAFGANVE